jgi:hypothetical protein
MIYALIEPSIYMIASILPTTRHLYRRIHGKVRQASQLRNSKSGGSAEHGNTSTRPAELQHIETGDLSSHSIGRHVDIFQTHTDSSQEELTMGEWYQNEHKRNPARLRGPR